MKQIYKIHNNETTVRVLNSEVSAVRKKDIVKKAVRVIEDGYIGISGGLGDIDESKLEMEARENLSIGIPYPYKMEEVQMKEVNINECTLDHHSLMSTVEDIMAFLRKDYPEFDFSEVATLVETEVHFKDDRGTNLKYADKHVNLGFLMKEKALANLFDGFIGYGGRKYDHNRFIETSRMFLDGYKTKLEMPEEDELPILIVDDSIFHGRLMKDLNGERYGNGSSLVANKVNEKIFNEKINIVQDFNPLTAHRPFFDMEGVVNKNYEYTLVENGVLKACYTDKKNASEYDLLETGSASGEYDDIPALQMTHLTLKTDSKNLEETVKKGIIIVIAAGGDYTSDGSYATPVQKAFLYEDGKIKGVLPEFQLRSHLFKMLGDDYIGTFDSPFYLGDHEKVTVTKMKIDK
ncbi:MAG: hypothetical protein JXR88_06690 [Clostridia bacterium]|nr:hypothetical protein [Clostridia bacterium]